MGTGKATNGLRMIALDQLVVGEEMPGDLLDRTGRVLLKRGQRLSAERRRKLEQRGLFSLYAGPNWPDLPANPTDEDHNAITPAELVLIMKRRRRARSDGVKARRHERHSWRTRLSITIQEATRGMIHRHATIVSTCDISANGFSFSCDRFLYPGTVVFVRFEALPNRPVMKGVVRNCTHVSGRRHRAGVQFAALEPGDCFCAE